MTPLQAGRERPILFNADMVRAILDGRKTQTRRIIQPQPTADGVVQPWEGSLHGEWAVEDYDDWTPVKCPYGQPGDRLYVRESHWRYGTWVPGWAPKRTRSFVPWHSGAAAESPLGIRFDGPGPQYAMTPSENGGPEWVKRPSIHMPRWASRITLEVTDVRVERVQDISEEDARAEGVNGGCLECGEPQPCGCASPTPDHRDAFVFLWDSINAKRGFGWDANPWVWAVTFKLLEAS